ncbi:N-acetylmuramoyl-L-alanine amidase [Roseobacter sp.]|uniref:N-acetylmuramoyl-L-alanine amidase n=1 Tax=Roseobacter sp. TaxID=1907202 RepID=UPI00329744E5
MPTIVVVHYTAMQTAQAAIERLCDPVAEVSAHYLICRSGALTQMVPEDQRAWHAGAGEWRGETDINSRSIGIELDNDGTHPFSEPQMAALETLLRGILRRWTIAPDNVIGHSDMAPGRKIDPGPRFDWARLAHQTLAAPAGRGKGPQNPTSAGFRALARTAGYTADVDDKTLLDTVRLRFRPAASGPLHPDDFASLGLIVPPT